MKATEQYKAVIPCLPINDTIKKKSGNHIAETVDRSTLVAVQTPQAFFYTLIREAYNNAFADNVFATDDAALVERLGGKVFTVEGEPINFKITTTDDFVYAKYLIENGIWEIA